MASTIDDIGIEYEEEGTVLTKEIDKEILSRGAWTTIIFKYQQWEPAKNAYSDDKYSIRRYKKVGGEFRQQSKFNISNPEQAKKIVEVLQRWT